MGFVGEAASLCLEVAFAVAMNIFANLVVL